MSTPTPRHGPGQRKIRDEHPGRRNQGFALAVALIAAVIGALAVQGTMYTVVLSAVEPASSTSTATTQPAAATTTPSSTTAALEAACEASMRADLETDADETLAPACYEIGGDAAQAILDRIASEYGVDTSATTPAPAAKPAAPKGVTVSGDYAGSVTIRSFRAKRDALDSFSVALRLQNTGSEDIEWMAVKVTALRGEEIVATGDGLVESIAAGQTITTETLSTDDFPASAKGITYEVELGS